MLGRPHSLLERAAGQGQHPMVIMSWKSTFMVPRVCAGAISARYSGATCPSSSLHSAATLACTPRQSRCPGLCVGGHPYLAAAAALAHAATHSCSRQAEQSAVQQSAVQRAVYCCLTVRSQVPTVVPPPTPSPSTRRPSTTMEMCSAPALSAAPTTNVTPDTISTHCGHSVRSQGLKGLAHVQAFLYLRQHAWWPACPTRSDTTRVLT